MNNLSENEWTKEISTKKKIKYLKKYIKENKYMKYKNKNHILVLVIYYKIIVNN